MRRVRWQIIAFVPVCNYQPKTGNLRSIGRTSISAFQRLFKKISGEILSHPHKLYHYVKYENDVAVSQKSIFYVTEMRFLVTVTEVRCLIQQCHGYNGFLELHRFGS